MSSGGWIPWHNGKEKKVGDTAFMAYNIGYEKGRASVKRKTTKRKTTTKRRR